MAKFAEINDVLVILKDHSGDPGADAFGDFDLSTKFITIEYDDSESQNTIISLNAKNGRYLTRAPKIKKRDRIYVKITEKNGNITDDVFHVRRIKRKNKPGLGMTLDLICPHQSENHWNKTISFKKRGKRISGNRALELIINDINANRGTSEPLIEIPITFDTVRKTGNRFDKNTNNNYFFDALKVKSAIDQIKDIESQPVEGGGSFERMYVRFKSKYNHATHSDIDVVELQAFEQGYQDDGLGVFTNIPNVTLINPTLGSGNRPNILSMDSNEDPEEATNIIVISDKNSGSYPTDLMKYQGAKEVFLSARQWNSITSYNEGQLVILNNITYECIANNTNIVPPNVTYWIVRTFVKPGIWSNLIAYAKNTLVRHNDIAYKALIDTFTGTPPSIAKTDWVRISFAPTTDYSKLTKDKAQYWINALAGAKYAATNNAKTRIIDPTVIIDDSLHPRTHVDYANVDPALIPAELLVDGKIPDAFRMLAIFPFGHASVGVEGGTGVFVGNDETGLPFAGNIIEFIDGDNDGIGKWVVFKNKVTNQDQEVFEWYENASWVKNPCQGGTVNSIGTCSIARQTKWIIGSYILPNTAAGTPKLATWVGGRPFECAHAVKWDSVNLRVDMGNEKILNELLDSATSAVFVKTDGNSALLANDKYSLFAGFNIHSRWPRTSNAIPYGAVSAGQAIKNPTTDLNNMDLTHLLKSEWFGSGVEDYYPFQAIAGWMKLEINDLILQFFESLDGDFTIGVWMADRNDAVMVMEFTIGKNFQTLPMEAHFSKLKAFQAVPGPSMFLVANEPDGTVAFDPTEFLVGGIYTRDSFDTQGRYKDVFQGSRFESKSTMKMSLDMFRFTKPVVATNLDEPDNKPNVNIETLKIQKPSITGYSQAKNLALGLDKLLNFDRREITVEVTNGRDVHFGDSIYVNDPKMIDDADDLIPNTFKGVVESVSISVSKTKNGPAGIKKFVRLVRRFWPT